MLFSVTNMTCGGCVHSITKAIQAADPKALVAADLEARRVVVETSLNAGEIEAVLASAGYQAQPLRG
jgi:copper chaperone CopZ